MTRKPEAIRLSPAAPQPRPTPMPQHQDGNDDVASVGWAYPQPRPGPMPEHQDGNDDVQTQGFDGEGGRTRVRDQPKPATYTSTTVDP